MTTVRIYQTFKNPRQSGMKTSRTWTLTFEDKAPPSPSFPMGWLSSQDTDQELCLSFPSLLKAVEYAKLNGFSYAVHAPLKKEMPLKSYEDSLKYRNKRR